jgi:DNA-binding LytR/AlgR family response regulator
MNVIIIEDEKPAAQKLAKALREMDALSVHVTGILNSAEEAIEWFGKNAQPDLVFMDIELTDGLSFTIFESCQISCPVIFTTAYDNYWQEAFEHNSIDYLLKPVKSEKLLASLKKYEKIKNHFTGNVARLRDYVHDQENPYKNRMLVRRGTELISVKTTDIAYCYALYKLVCMITAENQKYVLDRSLSDVENELEPSRFFRINRKYLVNINAIKKVSLYGKGKLIVSLTPAASEDLIITADKAGAFKVWLDK